MAAKWLDALLPALPAELAQALHRASDGGDLAAEARLWRWVRFQLALAAGQVEASDTAPAFRHWHFGFDDQPFRNRLARAAQVLLSIEAAQYSLAAWPGLPAWLAAPPPDPAPLWLFNPLNWLRPTAPLHWPVRVGVGGVLASPGGSAEDVRLAATQPALYENGPLAPADPLAAERMRAYYLPPAGAAHACLTQGVVSGCPLPVAAWTSPALGTKLTDALRAANSASTSPLVWAVGREAAGYLKAALLKRSSILLFGGRVPAAGTYSRQAGPEVRLVLATTTRPRALRWGEVPAPWHTVQTGPALAEWFGLPAARELTYEAQYFYDAPAAGQPQEQELTALVARYTAIQTSENQRRAARDIPDLLAPLPWNLLHWIRDPASAAAVFEHKARQLASLDPEPKRQLLDLLRRLTGLLAELRPVWQQLAALPATEPAYVVVPIHVARPAYLPGWLALTQDLRTRPLPALAHLTFISLSELRRTAENPGWPVYVTTVEPRYWWALRQLPAATSLRWRLYRPLLHNSFCHALHQQHAHESQALHQLLPLTALAADPAQAAADLAAEVQACALALQLPAYTPPARFERVGTERPEEPAGRPAFPAPTPGAGYRRPGYSSVVDWPDLSAGELQAAEELGAVPDEPTWLELDEGVGAAPPTALTTAADRDQATHWQRAEEEAAVAEAELAAEAPAPLPAAAPVAGPRPAAGRPPGCRLVWQRHPARAGAFVRGQLSQVPAGAFYFDEQELRQRLRRAAAPPARPVPAGGLPFWKQALREAVQKESRNRPDWLHAKMKSGGFGGTKLNLEYATFLRDYLAWDQHRRPAASKSRLPGSYQNRAVVAQVIGSGRGAQDEMQLLGWELATGRTLTSAEGQHLRQQLQAARQALWAWWQQRPGRPDELELTEAALQQELATYAAAHAPLFGPAFHQQTGKALGDLVSDYFLGLLLEGLRKQPCW